MTGAKEEKPYFGWQAGIARVDITPPLGVWLQGFGNRIHGATGIYDPLYTTALVLDNGAEQVAIVSCDLLCLDYSDVCKARTLIAAATGIHADHVLVHTTHTHSGPLCTDLRGFGTRDGAYDAILLRKICSAVQLAVQRKQPARLTFGTAETSIGVNRRAMQGGQIVIGEAPEGVVDNTTAVLGIWPIAGGTTPFGVVVWAAVHPVVLGGENYWISRDFPGCAVDRIERAYPGTICLYLTGPCGNVNPRGRKLGINLQELAERHGNTLAGAAMVALAGNSHSIDRTKLVCVSESVNVPLLPLPAEEEVLAQAEAIRRTIIASGVAVNTKLAIDYRLLWAAAALASLRGEPGAETQSNFITVQLQAVLIGDLLLTALPFEAFVEFQHDAAMTAPCPHSLVVGYANGDYGYMFDEAAFDEGGYEVDGAYKLYALQRFAKQAPTAVREGIGRLHAQVSQVIESPVHSELA